jgi:hypothetical protein
VLEGPAAVSLQEELASVEKECVEISISIWSIAERLVTLGANEGGADCFPFEIERCLGALGIVECKNE